MTKPPNSNRAPDARTSDTESAPDNDVEDARTQRRRLAAVWLGAGSAVAAMVAVSWYVAAVNGAAPGGDMLGHAAAAQWLRTLPWWDWRGWSDWFYGGQAIGVNYPPLGHAWMRFTDPVHAQMAAVAAGLLVLLPWGALRLARAVGCAPRAQRAAVGAVLVLVAASAGMHQVLSGFHQQYTFFGSWPAMLAVVIGLHAAAWAARCHRPVACGVAAGVAVLFNASVVPGVAVVCAVLLAGSGVSFLQACRWAVTAGAAAVAVCAWWLVPFLAGWDRLVRFEVSLSASWGLGGVWQAAVLALAGAAAAWAGRAAQGPFRRLALAAGAGLLAAMLADLFGYLRPERWLELPLLVAAAAAAGLWAAAPRRGSLRPVRPAWAVLGVAFLVVFVVITLRLELLPLAVWLMWGSRRIWACSSALAWSAVLLLVPFVGPIRSPAPPEPRPVAPLEAAAAQSGPGAGGLVYAEHLYNTASGDVGVCAWGHPWGTTLATGGRIRPLFGLYRETSASAEFLTADIGLRDGAFEGGVRPHWFDAWQDAGGRSLYSPARAEALGARWYAACDADGNVTVTELSGVMATGVTVAPHPDEGSWHRAAVEWWMSMDAANESLAGSAGPAPSRGSAPDGDAVSLRRTPEFERVPVLWPGGGESGARPPDQSAAGVALHTGQDSLTVRAEAAGWAWLRVPWDPDWHSTGDTPVLKGGPGHLIVWAERGVTELRWSVPGTVDAAAAATTGASLLAVGALAAVNRRRGFEAEPDRRRRAADALEVFADTVDGWVRAAARRAGEAVSRVWRRLPSKRSR